MKKKAVIVVGAIFVLIIGWRAGVLIFGDGKLATRGGAPAVAVEVAEVSREAIRETRQLSGSIFPKYQYIVAPKVAGRVIRIYKNIGDWVEEGDLIARIDDAEYRQALLEAEANLKISQATLAEVEIQFDLARQELDRVQSLQNKGIASSAELDAAASSFSSFESRIKLAKAQVEQRSAALNSARIRLSYTSLNAPKAGFVGQRFVDEGNLLAPNAALALIVGIDSVVVRASVVEKVYGRIQLGQSAEIAIDAFPDRIFTGTVARIAPMLQEASRVAQIEIEVANDSLLLKPGMFCILSLVLSEKDSAQVVPSQAIVTRESQIGVFLIDEEKPLAHFIPIEKGIENADRTEIVSPELKGAVVTLGQHLLKEGSSVILPGAKAENQGRDSR